MKRETIGGINAIAGVLDHAPERLIRLWSRGGSARLQVLEHRAREAGITVQQADTRVLDRMVGDTHHQGVAAEVVPLAPLDLDGLLARVEQAGGDALVLVLDGVVDPHNLGACLRSAAAAGATAVVVPKSRAAGLTAAARRAAAGAAEFMPLAVVSNLASALRRLAELQVWCIGLAGDSDTSLYATDLRGPLALVVGGEEKGLRRLTREHCDVLAGIPMAGSTESLNVSVSAGVALFEAIRQREKSPSSLAKGS